MCNIIKQFNYTYIVFLHLTKFYTCYGGPTKFSGINNTLQ